MINEGNIIIKGFNLKFGEEYFLIYNRLKNEIFTFSDLDKEGNAFITIRNVEAFGIKGEATLFFHMKVLDNIVLSPNWNMYNLIKRNGERMCIDEAAYLVYKRCHDFLEKNFGTKVNDEYIPEVFKISRYHFAALYMTPGGDNVSLVLRGIM